MIAKAASATLLAALGASACGWAATPPITIPSETAPPAVVALGSLADVAALAVSPDASLAVSVAPSSRGPGRSILRLGRADGTLQNVDIEGEVLGLVITPRADALLAVIREKDKKGAIRRADLVRLDLPAARPGIAVVLPTTAQGVAIAAGGTAAIVADKDEVRTFVLPRLTSGPLYRISGENALLAPLSGTTRLLVAQGSRLALVDLAAPQSREGLALLESVDAGSTIRALASSPEDPLAMAATADGRTLDVHVDPLRLTDRPAAVAFAWPGVPAAPSPVAHAAAAAAATVAVPAPGATIAAGEPAHVPEHAPATDPAAAHDTGTVAAERTTTAAAAATTVAAGESAAAPPSSAPGTPAPPPAPATAPADVAAPSAPPPPASVAPPAVPGSSGVSPATTATAEPPKAEPAREAAPAPSTETSGPAGTVTGTLTGPARAEAAAVVALGPDNVLREAARAAPGGDGSFAFHGLVPGSYRIVATGANGRVLLCHPPFLTLKVTESGAVQAPSIEVLKAY